MLVEVPKYLNLESFVSLARYKSTCPDIEELMFRTSKRLDGLEH